MSGGYKFIALLCTFALTALGETSVQTGWSEGPGLPGPESTWSEGFFRANLADWASTAGAVSVQTASEEHLIGQEFGNASFLACADLDNDGDQDVACASYTDNELAWFENLGGGTSWEEHTIEAYLPSACVISTGDIDKDGLPDLMCASEGGDGICWWRNINWAESWEKNEVDTSCSYPFSMEPWDLDMDGDVDLCAALYGRGEIVWYSNEDSVGTDWTKHVIEDGFASAWWAVPADFNLDGKPDVAGARHGGEINWWENDGTGSFIDEHSIATGYSQCTTIRNCNLNGDALPDIAAASNAGRIAWWENSSNGSVWTEHVIDDELSGGWSLWASDVDGDGDQDVIGNDRKGDCVYLYENVDGAGTLWMKRLLNQGMDMSNDVNAADLDGDGFPDPLATFGGDDTIYWWKLDQGFQPAAWLESTILDMGQDAQWGQIVWSCAEPSGCSVSVSVRAGDDPEGLGDWVPIPESGTDLSAYVPDNSRYLQYRLDMDSQGGFSPEFTELLIDWTPMGIGTEPFTWNVLGAPSPNPSSGPVLIGIDPTYEGPVMILDMTGRLVSSLDAHGGSDVLTGNLGHLPSGAYRLLVLTEGGPETAELTVLTR